MARPRWSTPCFSSPMCSTSARKCRTGVMDSNDLEREKGITILAKNTAVEYTWTACREIRSPGGHHDQRHRHARPRRFRRRGGARHLDGRRRRATRRCLGGPAATDPFRAAQGARGQAAGHPVREQGGSSRRSHRGGRGRGLRSAAWLGAGCDRGGCATSTSTHCSTCR